ncbi:hypothetical protein FA220_14755 [Pseudomonas aeruginosa]|nr:hypothetical protein [Pseudomonas aeruginosa]
MIEIRSLRDLLRLLFIYQREFKLAALSAVVIIVLGAFLLPAKYESNARLLVKPGRDSTLPIEISNRQALVMPSTQRDPIVDEERLLTGRPIVRQVAERYLEVLANRPPPEGLWKRTKFYVKKAIGAVFDGIRVTLETFGEMALRKADALLKPFFVTMLGYVILRDLLRGQPLLPDIGGVLYASVDTLPWQALWYLPHFWVATLFAWFMLRVIQRLGLSLAASCVLLAVQLGLGILFLKTFWQIPVEFGGEQYLLPGLPFSLDIALISSAHFMFGYVLRDVLRRHQSSLLTLCIALAVTTASFLYYPTVVDMAQRRYDHWFWATVQAVSGVYLCWALSGLMMKIDWLGKAMTYIGQSTLILLIFHGEIQHKTFNLLVHLGLSEPAAASVALVISVIVSLLIGEVIKRVALLRALYFPFPVRKKTAAVQGGGEAR